jgi:formate hydrogenlyase subunit 3/multisubunit Na+/H+ antiporter MnhD subunit
MSVRLIGVVATFATASVAAALATLGFLHGDTTLWVAQSQIPLLSLTAGVTSLASPFLALVAILATAVAFWGISRGRPSDVALVAAFAISMVLVLISQSVMFFFLAWEAMSLTSVFLVAAHHERRDVRRAALTYLLVAQTGALCLVTSLAMLALHAGDPTFGEIARHAADLPPTLRNIAFTLAFIGFGSKAGALPLHFWLPRAHPVAPPNGSALLSGAMLKVAVYGLMLIVFQLAAPGPLSWGVAVIIVGTASAVVGVLYALVDHDLKRLLAYHSIENIGIIFIGIGVALIAQAQGNIVLAGLAIVAALFHSINHGLFKSLLFLGAGTVAETTGTVDLERLGGLGNRLVWTAPLFLVGCAAIIGMPPFNGFASEWLTFQGIVHGISSSTSEVSLILLGSFAGLALAAGLAAACFVKVYGIAFLGAARRYDPQSIPLERFDASVFSLALLAGLCLVFGVAPMLALGPLRAIAGIMLGAAPDLPGSVAILPVSLVALPIAGVIAAVALSTARKIRYVPTWTCGSPVTPKAQYTATAFSKPLRTIFAFILMPERQVTVEESRSKWFPSRILYRMQGRYVVDELARRFAAVTMRLARSSRALQSGSLRLYIAYAAIAAVVAADVVSGGSALNREGLARR